MGERRKIIALTAAALPVALTIGAHAADLSSTTIKPISPMVSPTISTQPITATLPPEVTGFQPSGCVAKGGTITILGRNFGTQSGKSAALGGNGIHVDLTVSSWSASSIVATIPNDAAIQMGSSYYIGIEKTGHTQWLSNISRNVTICATTPSMAPVAPVPTSSPPTMPTGTSVPAGDTATASATATDSTSSAESSSNSASETRGSMSTKPSVSSSGSLLQSQLPPLPANLPPAPGKQDPTIEPGELVVVSASVEEANAVAGAGRALGLAIKRRTSLRGLGFVVTVFRVPKEASVGDALSALRREQPNLWADANHRYELMAVDDPKQAAAQLIGWTTSPECGRGLTIGMIDTAIETGHGALGGNNITARSFLAAGVEPAKPAHGTATAALLIGKGEVEGMLPGAKLLAAGVFRQRSSKDIDTTADAVIQALDWLATERVAVINLSLGGPRNLIVEAAVQRILGAGIAVVAAAGNGGPDAKPVYPAAQDGVIAVTAIDAKLKAYDRANRGDYISFAAPGVEVHTAAAAGGTVYVSGTSYAAPFVTAAVASMLSKKQDMQFVRKRLQETARDLGAPGKDPVFGWGLVQTPGCGKAIARKK